MKMKDKNAAQSEAKEKHRVNLQAAKARRRSEPNLERSEPTKKERPTILIVCEGKNTEPSYFKKFKLASAIIKTLGNGKNTLSLVKQAINLKIQNNYEQVWCVFDKDSFPINNFNNAIALAEANDLKVAYSNQAFEYWLILHFEDHQGGAMPRSDYAAKINQYINPLGAIFDGQKNKIISDDFFDILMGKDPRLKEPRIKLAIQRAKRNYNNLDHESPALEESSTLVFRLAEEILSFIDN